MQRVLATTFTADARFVLSGSDDCNVRVWKANASEKLGIVTARERSAIEYRDALKERWKTDAEIGKVQRCAPFLFVLTMVCPSTHLFPWCPPLFFE
jgi:WD repeat and SOF domain-containing protein 1